MANDLKDHGSVAIKKWVIVGITLQAVSAILYVLGGLVWQREQNPFLGLSTSITSNLTKSVWVVMLYWQINRRKNWARRLLVVYALVSLPFLPSIIAPTADRWHPSRFGFLWDVAVATTAAEGIFLLALAAFLLTPSVRSDFTPKPLPFAPRALLALYSSAALLAGLLLIRGTHSLRRAAQTGTPPHWLTRLADKQTDEELARLQQETGVKVPRFGFVSNVIRKPDLWIVAMVNLQSQALIMAIAPADDKIDLAKRFEELDEQKARRVQAAGWLVHRLLENHPDGWSRFSPTRVAEETTGVNNSDLRLTRVSFPSRMQPTEGFMTELVIRGKNIVCLGYGKGDVRKRLVASSEELLSENVHTGETNAIGRSAKLGPSSLTDEARAYVKLSANHYRMAEFEKAREAAQRAIVLDSRQPDAYEDLGAASEKLGQPDKAIEAYENAIHLKPDDPVFLKNLAGAYAAAGRYADAVATVQQAVELKPDYVEAYSDLGAFYYQMKRYKDAIAPSRKAIALDSDYVPAYINLGSVYGKLGRYKEAIESLQGALTRSPKNPSAHYDLGFLYTLIGNRDGARHEHEILKKVDTAAARNLGDEIQQHFDRHQQ